MSFPITILLTGIFALMIVVLSLLVSVRRLKTQNTSINGDKDELLCKRIRAHGNFVEYAPLALICVGLIEYSGGNRILVVCVALAFLFSRILHAITLILTESVIPKAIAMSLQHIGFAVSGIWLIARSLIMI